MMLGTALKGGMHWPFESHVYDVAPPLVMTSPVREDAISPADKIQRTASHKRFMEST